MCTSNNKLEREIYKKLAGVDSSGENIRPPIAVGAMERRKLEFYFFTPFGFFVV